MSQRCPHTHMFIEQFRRGVAIFPVTTHSALECCTVVIIKILSHPLHPNYCFSYGNICGALSLHSLGCLLWIFCCDCVYCYAILWFLGCFPLLLFSEAACVMLISRVLRMNQLLRSYGVSYCKTSDLCMTYCIIKIATEHLVYCALLHLEHFH